MNGVEIFLMDMPAWVVGEVWDEIVRTTDPDDLLYAAFAYVIHNESYFLENLTMIASPDDDEPEEECRYHDELIGNWMDRFFLYFEDIGRELRGHKDRLLAGAHYDFYTQSLTVVMKARESNEPYFPSWVTFPSKSGVRITS